MRGGIGLMTMRWRSCRGGRRVRWWRWRKWERVAFSGDFFCLLFMLCDDGMMR